MWLWASLLGLGLMAGPMGCAHKSSPKAALPPPEPAPLVLDYGNGWFHPSDGRESISQIAGRYKRDPQLVAQLNKTLVTAVPAAGARLYIPPSNDRQRVRDVLIKVHAHPELVPPTPWNCKTPSPTLKTEIKLASHDLKAKAPEPAAAREGQKKKKSWFHWGREHHESKPVLAEAKQAAPAPATSGRFVWPVDGRVMTRFKEGWQGGFHGIEIAANDGAPVKAARPGKVLMAQFLLGYGNLILIDHGDGFATAYGYNRDLLVKEGQQVGGGQRIASVGRPSRGSASRLFFQIRRNATPVDPEKFLY
jgi:murein DD-endopeptidase MepM/ murein hydrolase activator NlpD